MKKLIVSLIISCLSFAAVMANKTSVEIKTPDNAKAGDEITITINVMHKGNSKGHHTDWVFLKINGKEVKRWSYDKNSLPPGETFTLEYKVIANGELVVEVQGNCNIHGSAGEKKVTIKTS